VMYYFAIITFIMMPRGDPGETNQPCLRVGCHMEPATRLLPEFYPLSIALLTDFPP
jgi:hypothetical protein